MADDIARTGAAAIAAMIEARAAFKALQLELARAVAREVVRLTIELGAGDLAAARLAEQRLAIVPLDERNEAWTAAWRRCIEIQAQPVNAYFEAEQLRRDGVRFH